MDLKVTGFGFQEGKFTIQGRAESAQQALQLIAALAGMAVAVSEEEPPEDDATETVLDTEIGPVRVHELADGTFRVAQGELFALGSSQDEALAKFLEKHTPPAPAKEVTQTTTPPKRTRRSKEKEPEKKAQSSEPDDDFNDPEDEEAPPPDLAKCGTFREVMVWMLAHGFKTPDKILAQCKAYARFVPAIDRSMSNIEGRIDRALSYMAANG